MIELNYNLENIVYFCEQDNVWKTEVFKDIPDYEGIFQISDIGRIKGLGRNVKNGHGYRFVEERILKPSIRRDGYLYCILKKKNVAIHQLVAMAFLGHERCKFETVVDHKNNVKTDNRLLNLQLVSNRFNSTKDISNKTGFIGVTKQRGTFKATIRDNGEHIYLGSFKTPELAHEAYKKRRKEIESRNLHKQI